MYVSDFPWTQAHSPNNDDLFVLSFAAGYRLQNTLCSQLHICSDSIVCLADLENLTDIFITASPFCNPPDSGVEKVSKHRQAVELVGLEGVGGGV